MRTSTAIAIVFGAIAAHSDAHASVTYLTQNRSVAGSFTTTGTSTQTVSAPDFAPFNQSVNNFDTISQSGVGAASQGSTLGQTAITNISHASGTGGNHFSSGAGASSFLVTFSVDAPTPWAISGGYSFNFRNGAGGVAQGVMSLNFQQQGGPTLYSSTFAPTTLSGTFAQSGTLLPGNIYSLGITIQDSCGLALQEGFGDVNATLSFVPSPSVATLLAPATLVFMRRRRR